MHVCIRSYGYYYILVSRVHRDTARSTNELVANTPNQLECMAIHRHEEEKRNGEKIRKLRHIRER